MKPENILFVHIPRTGGRSVLRAVGQEFKCQHKSIGEYCAALGEAEVKAKHKVTTIRNPWDRAVSWFSFFGPMGPVNPDTTFESWLEQKFSQWRNLQRCGKTRKYPLSQFSYLKGPDGKLWVDSFLQFESLSTDWARFVKQNQLGVKATLERVGIEERHGASSISLRKHRGFPEIPADWRALYTSQGLIDAVATMDQEVIEKFGYTF